MNPCTPQPHQPHQPPQPRPSHRLGIDELTARAGVSQRLVLECAARGLIANAEGPDALAPRYSHEDVGVLRFVRRAHALGFGMDEVARLLALRQHAQCASAEVKRITLTQAEALDGQIEELQATKRLLERLAGLCLGEHQPACPILDELLELKGFAGAWPVDGAGAS